MEKNGGMICPNCGARVAENEAKCPYCGTMYYPEAERQYMEKLDDIKEEMDQMPEKTAEIYKKRTGHSVKKLMTGIGIGCAVLLAVVGGYRLKEAAEEKKDHENQIMQMQWLREHETMLDELYKNGEFDKIMEIREANPEIDFGRWDHATFLIYYRYYVLCCGYEERLEAGETLDAYELGQAAMAAMSLLYEAEEEPELDEDSREVYSFGLTKKDMEYIEEYQEIAQTLLHEKLMVTEEEAKRFYQENRDEYGIVSWEAFEEYGKTLEDRLGGK